MAPNISLLIGPPGDPGRDGLNGTAGVPGRPVRAIILHKIVYKTMLKLL